MSLAVTGVNIQQELDRVKEFWKPLVVGRVNNQLIKVAKLSGEFFCKRPENTPSEIRN